MWHNFDWSGTDRRTPSIFDNHVLGSFCPCYYHGKQNEKYQGIGQNKSFGTLNVETFNYKDYKRSLEWLRKTICISWWCTMFQLLLNCNRFSCDLSLSLLWNALCESHLWLILANHPFRHFWVADYGVYFRKLFVQCLSIEQIVLILSKTILVKMHV